MMEFGESTPTSAAETAENIARYNVWSGLYTAGAQDMLNLDGLAVSYVAAQDIVSITLPIKHYPAVTIQYVKGSVESPERLLVTEHRPIPNPQPNSTAQLLKTTTTSLFPSGRRPNSIRVWHGMTRRGQVKDQTEFSLNPSETDDLSALDQLFVEMDDARRRFVHRRADQQPSAQRQTLGKRLSKLLGSKIVK